jgi:hypothetical protein
MRPYFDRIAITWNLVCAKDIELRRGLSCILYMKVAGMLH